MWEHASRLACSLCFQAITNLPMRTAGLSSSPRCRPPTFRLFRSCSGLSLALSSSAALGLLSAFSRPLQLLALRRSVSSRPARMGCPVRASGAIDKVDVIDDVLYLPEVLYMVLLALFVANGAGPFSLDAILSRYL